MKLNWDSVHYLFQIPLGWFRDVDRKTNVITDGHYLMADRNNTEGTVLTINKDAFGEGFVTLDTEQTITGAKTFSDGTSLFGLDIYLTTGNNFRVKAASNDWAQMSLVVGDVFSGQLSAQAGDMRISALKQSGNSYDYNSLQIDFGGPNGGKRQLIDAPSGAYSDDDNQIATRAWTRSNFANAGVSAIVADITMTVLGDTKVPASVLYGDFSGHSGTSLLTVGNDGSIGCSQNTAYNFLYNASQVSGATKLLTDKDVYDGTSGTLLTADDLYDGTDGLILTIDDIYDATTNPGGTVMPVPSGAYSGQLVVVTGVEWNANTHTLSYNKKTLAFVNGLLTSNNGTLPSNVSETVDTATVVTWR